MERKPQKITIYALTLVIFTHPTKHTNGKNPSMHQIRYTLIHHYAIFNVRNAHPCTKNKIPYQTNSARTFFRASSKRTPNKRQIPADFSKPPSSTENSFLTKKKAKMNNFNGFDLRNSELYNMQPNKCSCRVLLHKTPTSPMKGLRIKPPSSSLAV